MRSRFVLVLLALSFLVTGSPVFAEEPKAEADNAAANPKVTIETSKGTIVVEVFADQAPKSAANFLQYVRDGFYDGTLFHRVIPKFMVQGGGFDAEMRKKPTRPPITNEADNGLKNERGTLAMARTGDPHSATAQFFINSIDNSFLNHRSKASGQTWGYAVFGRVVDGMEVVDAISAVPTTNKGMMRDVPVDPVSIVKMTVQGE